MQIFSPFFHWAVWFFCCRAVWAVCIFWRLIPFWSLRLQILCTPSPPPATPSCRLLTGGMFAPCRTVGNVWEHLGVSHRCGVSRVASSEPRPGCPSPHCLLQQHRATPCFAQDSSTQPRIIQLQTELEKPQDRLGQWCKNTLPPERPLRRN